MLTKDNYLVIEPRHSIFSFEWREFWRFRELFFMMVWRDVKVRYKQTYLGASWAIFQPFVSMIVFSVFFGALVKVPSDNIPYPIFVYAGLLPWTFFSNGLNRASMSLLNEVNMISKIYFPRLILPISSFGAGVIDLAISCLLMGGMMIYYNVSIRFSILICPPLIVISFIAALGIGCLLAALTVAFRDIKYISPFLIQIWMYITPVIYPVSVVPQKWRWVLNLNPMTGVIDGCRSAIFGKPINWDSIGLSLIISFAFMAIGLLYFKKSEQQFADII
jgi:lipopolysaccharide transport system permease protein